MLHASDRHALWYIDRFETPAARHSASTPIPTVTRAWHLERRPAGQPAPADFAIKATPLTALEDGQILVVNEVLSVDPYMRGRMSAKKSYIDPYDVGAPMDRPAVGRVLASRAEGFEVGDHAFHGLGWRAHAVLDAATAYKVDPNLAPLSAYLGVLGVPGVTAYIGVERFAEITGGETVYVSGAAGAVGSVAGQIAKLKGAARVIGSAGSTRRSHNSSNGSDSTPRSTTRPAQSPSSSRRLPPKASTCSSTTSAGRPSRQRSARSTSTPASC